MRKISMLVTVGTLLLFGLGMNVLAQDEPTKIELGIDYSLLDFNPSANYTHSQVLNGGGVSFVYFAKHWLGLKMDLQGYGNSAQTFVIPAGNAIVPAGGSFNVSGQMFTYLFGPEIKRRGRIEPYFQLLLGGANSNVYTHLSSNIPAGKTASAAAGSDAFSFTTGFGVDIHVNRLFSFRPLEVGYLLTTFNNSFAGSSQNTFRYSAGITFNLK
jgi:hypothetical protein